jgi:hypothetical protein
MIDHQMLFASLQSGRPSEQSERTSYVHTGVKGGFMGNKGKSGCGCLLVILVVCMVFVGALMHPFTLKLIAKQMRHEDKIVPADIILVPRFVEDKNGELYMDAFREYLAGNGKAIYVEEDKIFGVSIESLITKLATTKGIKENVVKVIDVEGDGIAKLNKINEEFQTMGSKNVIVLAPEYASKRFRLLYDSLQGVGKIIYMIKPVGVTYFKKDKWWKDSTSRWALFKEIYERGAYYWSTFTDEEKKK